MPEKRANSERDDSRWQAQLPESAARLGDSSFGTGLGIGLVLLALLAGFGIFTMATKWDGSFFSRQGCVEVQDRGGRFFKVDTCTGDVTEIAVDPKLIEGPSE